MIGAWSGSSVGLGEIVGLLSALAWGATGLMVRAHGAGVHAIVINAFRCTISGAAFVAWWLILSDHRPVPPAAWMFLGASLVLGLGLGDSLYFEALKRIGVARAMPISMGYPILASIGAVVLLQETLGPLAAVGIVFTLAGVYLVAVPGRGAALSARSNGSRRGYWVGVAMAAAAAISWSSSTLALGPALQLVDVPTASAIRTPLAGALLWTAAQRAGVLPEGRKLRGRALVALIATGLMSIASTGFFMESVALAGAGRAAVLSATAPLFAVPFSILFLGETGSWRVAAGTLCSVLGVVMLAQT